MPKRPAAELPALFLGELTIDLPEEATERCRKERWAFWAITPAQAQRLRKSGPSLPKNFDWYWRRSDLKGQRRIPGLNSWDLDYSAVAWALVYRARGVGNDAVREALEKRWSKRKVEVLRATKPAKGGMVARVIAPPQG